jgi:hypothetical protein
MKKYQKILIVIGVVIVALVTAIIFIFIWQGSPKKIVETADQFQPPSSWKLQSERVDNPRIICITDHACPEITRTWKTDSLVTFEEIKQLLGKTEWTINPEESCQTMNQVALSHETKYICTIQISTAAYWGYIYVSTPEVRENNELDVYLNLRPV